MLDINKLRNAYKVINQLSQNKNPFAEEELTLEIVQSAEVQAALRDAAEVVAVYGKIMNLVSQITNFSVAGVKVKKSFLGNSGGYCTVKDDRNAFVDFVCC